jgi:hypothetical protein
MNEYKIKWEGNPVTVRIHSELDDILKLCLEALIERSLNFNKGIVGEDPFSLSQYNKGQYLLLVEKLKDGYKVDFCLGSDLENIDEATSERIIKQMGFDAVMVNKSAVFSTSTRKMPWDS